MMGKDAGKELLSQAGPAFFGFQSGLTVDEGKNKGDCFEASCST